MDNCVDDTVLTLLDMRADAVDELVSHINH